MSSISVIIPNYNGHRTLPACLDSLARQVRPPDEIVVVDDASPDDSVALVRARYPQVTLLAQPANGGFCRTVNAGFRAARGDLLALLNNDTEADSHWLAALEAALAAHPEAGFAASKMLFAGQRDRVNSAGLFFRVDGVARDIGYGRPDGAAFAAPGYVFGASGGAAVYRRSALEAVGLFDEDFFAYGEDVDWSFRAQLLGYRCLYVPEAVVYHVGHASFGRGSARSVYYSSRNMVRVLAKNMPGRLLCRYLPRLLAAQIYQVLYFAARGQGPAVLRGKLSALRDLPRDLRKRRQILAGRRATDVQIAALLARGWEHRIADRH